MLRSSIIVAVMCVVGFACVPKRAPAPTVEASSTIEDMPVEPAPVVDAGVAEAKVEAPPAAVVTFVKAEATEGFSVMMPKDPQVERKTVPLKKGSVATVSMSSSVDGVIYSVTRAEYPEALAKKRGPKKMLDEARDGLANQLKGTVNDQKAAELVGHPGETFTVAGASNMVRARTAMVANQLYSLVVVYAGKVPEKADEFLNSIELKSAPPAPAAAPAPAAK